MSKFRLTYNLTSLGLLTTLSACANADWGVVCVGPTGSSRVSADYGIEFIESPLFAASMGISGTYAYAGASNKPPGCFLNGLTGNVRGRIGFGAGFLGTVQSTVDDDMDFTWGFKGGVIGSSAYAIIKEDNTASRFGANGFQTAFTGASDTYFYGRTTNNHVQIDLRCDLVADAAKLTWTLTNTDTVSHNIALGFGSTVSLLSETLGETRGTGPSLVAGGGIYGNGGLYVTVPGIKPPKTERRFTKALDPSGYPNSVFFNWDQQNGVGLQVQNVPDTATSDANDPSQNQTSTDSFVVGQSFFLLGWPPTADPTDFPNFIFQEPISDVLFGGDDGYIQFWNNQLVAPGTSRTINAFYRSTWGDSLYNKPYSVAVDTPKVLNLLSTDATQFSQNPFTIRVWVDNNRGFSTIDQDLPLQDVQIQLLLPDGLTAVGQSSKIINRIDPRTQGFVDFQVQADSFAAGDLTYQVRITPTPGPVKTITGMISVVSQPRIVLQPDANLITSPWSFTTPTWETILGMKPDVDYQAFAWDPVQKGYIVSTGPERGFAQWIVSKKGTQNLTLGGNPTAPTNFLADGNGAPVIGLKPGWNLIGNPYHVEIQLGELVGASNTNPTQSYTFAQLVKQGLISGSLAFWDTGTQNYSTIQNLTDHISPQKGYWIYVFASQDVFISYPQVFLTNARTVGKTVAKPAVWQQSDKQWRLQLVAKNQYSADTQNYIGVASSADNAKNLRAYKPPMAPLKNTLALSINQKVNGVDSRLSQALSDTGGKQEFAVNVESRQAGPVTVTWPNLSTIPKNVQVKLVDVASGETRDMRKVSGYTFQADAASIRNFKVQVSTGTVSRPMIGAVTVQPAGKGGKAIHVSYTLGADATTTIRILGNTGNEIMVLTPGRADKAGSNDVVWNQRDQANRPVPQGVYRVEIVAEGADGERVRRITPIVITR